MTVFPDYYPSFKCISNECKHNCCIGWEIDIDDETAQFYKTIDGCLKNRLSASIDWSSIPHFRLTSEERCPFLNSNNLCDIIINLGEDKLCHICKQHPRFFNYFDNYTEYGIGLCCEEAARIIIGCKSQTKLITNGNLIVTPDIIKLRNIAIDILQNRSLFINDRLSHLFRYFDIEPFVFEHKKWLQFLLNLEQLDNNWTKLISSVASEFNNIDTVKFDKYMQNRVQEYEQLCVYLIYRHLANAVNDVDFDARIRFVALAYYIIYYIGAYIFTINNSLPFEDQIEIIRMFSAEIEYSEENLESIFDKLAD